MGYGGKGGGQGASQATSNGQPVYWDADKGQYYTTSGSYGGYGGVDQRGPGYGGGSPLFGILAALSGGGTRNYLGNSLNQGSFKGPSSQSSTGGYQPSYSTYPKPSVGGDAFNSGVNSNSGIAAVLAGLYNSGVFDQQQLNPYAPNGTVGSWTGIPYGQQQESMFNKPNTGGMTAYGGYQGQSWNPYSNYYMPGANTSQNNNPPPSPNTYRPDAWQELSSIMATNPNQNTRV